KASRVNFGSDQKIRTQDQPINTQFSIGCQFIYHLLAGTYQQALGQIIQHKIASGKGDSP
ncbi:MAG: hypothetical protein OSA08_14145, partial [Arenicellales bacterium]|nr:hypothetical protein [Arenicellales bacterium]